MTTPTDVTGTAHDTDALLSGLRAALADEDDLISAMATIACELYHGYGAVSWAGFYRLVAGPRLKVGPYQGGHGCTTITLDHGICGRCARTGTTQIVADVDADPAHIACSPTTRSEIVVPIADERGRLRAVLDCDSEAPGRFTAADAAFLEAVAALLAPLWPLHDPSC